MLAELIARIEALEKQVKLIETEIMKFHQELVSKDAELEEAIDNLDNNTPGINHYHDEYANVDHVERSENSLERKISRVEESINNLEYRVNDAERKAERAQSTADDAKRSARGGW